MTSATGKGLFIGLDLGGTQVKVGLGAGSAELVWEGAVPTGAQGGREAVLSSLVGAAQAAREEAARRGQEVLAVGLGSPGVIDPTTGRALYHTANLPDWAGVDLAGTLRTHLGVPVRVANDANAATLAEWRWGAGRGCRSLVMATVGTGIGGGAVVDGRLLEGAWGAGMELGHIPYRENGRRCGCGKQGCLEAYCAARGMCAAWAEALVAEQGIEPADAARRTLRELVAAARAGDALALRLLDEGAHALATGLLTALYLLNPERVLLGGGVVDGYPELVSAVEAGMRARGLPKVTERLHIARAAFGNRAGVLGAIALVATRWTGRAAARKRQQPRV